MRKDSGKPLSDATVRVIPLREPMQRSLAKSGVSGPDGIFKYTFTEPVIIQISHLGFTSKQDTLYQAENKIYLLAPSIQNFSDVVVLASMEQAPRKNRFMQLRS